MVQISILASLFAKHRRGGRRRTAVVNAKRFRSVKNPGFGKNEVPCSVAPAIRPLAILFLLVFLLFAAGADAQLYTGSVTGVVTDPSGAAVPAAKVTLVDQDKGFTFAATTDSTGRYLLRPIPPGTYRISVEAANFQSQQQDGIKLDVTQNVSIDFSLKVGAATERVEVTANTVQLQTEDAVTGQVVNRKFVNDLPLNGRNFIDLTSLAPGVTETNVPGTSGGVNFNSNGGRNSTADVLIDGATVTNFEQNSGLQTLPYEPSVDSVEEFKVQQNNFTSEYGFAGGTIINVVTRSGTNQFHGTLYEFLRNSATDANEWFANKNGSPIPPLKRNNFGGVLGGPLRKDKTFFFFNYEGRRNRDFASNQFGVPTAAERKGDFGVLCGANGGTFDAQGLCSAASGQLWDPYTGTFNPDPAGNGSIGPGAVRTNAIPFNNLATYASPGNANLNGTPFSITPNVSGNLINPVAANFIKLYPQPTVNATDLATLQNQNFFTSGVTGSTNNQWDAKVDHRFSNSDLLSVKYSQQSGSSFGFNCYTNAADPCTAGPGTSTRHLLAINHTHTFSPTLVLTVTYGGLRAYDSSKGIGGEISNVDAVFTQVGFPAYLNRGFHTLPKINIGSGYNSPIGSQTFSIIRWGQETHHLGGALSWVRGKQEFKIGGEGRMHRINFVQPGQPSGQFGFDNTGTSQISSTSSGGDALASFLIGVGPAAGGNSTNSEQSGFLNAVSTQSFRFAEFVQDNYRVSSKLTLNLGLRYELSLPRTERFNRMNWLDPNAISPLSKSPLGILHGAEVFASPHDRSNYYADYKAIQPRFGVAYQLPHTFVFRGGYGIYFSTPRSGAAGTGPWGYQGFQVQPPWITTLPDRATPFNTLSNTSCQNTAPFTCRDVLPPGNSLGALNDIGNSAVGPIRSVSKNIPYEQTWSLGFQKELPLKMLFDASYVGKKGTHLYLGGFREHNFLPASVLNLTPAARSALTNSDPNGSPFFFNGVGTCDTTRFICDPNSSLFGPNITFAQEMVPFPQFSGFQGDSPPIANSIYHALQVRVEKEFSNGLQFLVTYAWSKSIDSASATDDSFSFLGGGDVNGNTLGVQNPYNLSAERAVSVFDIPQIFQFSYVYEFPLGRGKQFGSHMNSVLNAIVGGWQTNGIVRVDTGRPIIPGIDSSLNPQAIPTFGIRPNLTGKLGRSSGRPQDFTDLTNSANYFANPNALSHIPADSQGLHDDFALGNAPRTIGSVRQPGGRDVSMSLFKEFTLGKVREGMRLQFRAESFNTFNHPHFQGPNANVGASDYGKISSTVNSPRQLQFGLKLYF
jgi:hypothetical protein